MKDLTLLLTMLVLSLTSTVALATGLPSFSDGDRIIIFVFLFAFLAIIGLVPAALIYYKFRKKWIFLFSPVFGIILNFIYSYLG